jgi:hypothetical protein
MEASEQAGLLERTAVEYVVQVKGIYTAPGDTEAGGGPVTAWRDLTTVVVPPRTKRKTVVEKALEQAAQDIGPIEAQQPVQVRVLSPEDARPFKVSAVVREPELKIEGA